MLHGAVVNTGANSVASRSDACVFSPAPFPHVFLLCPIAALQLRAFSSFQRVAAMPTPSAPRMRANYDTFDVDFEPLPPPASLREWDLAGVMRMHLRHQDPKSDLDRRKTRGLDLD